MNIVVSKGLSKGLIMMLKQVIKEKINIKKCKEKFKGNKVSEQCL